MAHTPLYRSLILGWLLALLAAAPTIAQDEPASCTCPLGFGNWMRFEDSNVLPNMPDFWIEPSLDVDEISVCAHGVSFVITTRQNDNLVIASLFFPEPTIELMQTRLAGRLSGNLVRAEQSRLMDRYTSLRGRIVEQFGSSFDQYGRVVFRSMEPSERPKILDPHRRLALEWDSSTFELRGYLDVYFTQLM